MLIEEKVQVMGIIEKSKDIIRLKTSGGFKRAILYRRICRDISIGDWLIVNTTAGHLNLGTGGWDIVRTVLSDRPSPEMSNPDGHIMKLRYSSDQHSVLALESPESEVHGLFHSPLNLKNKCVFIGELHSILPIIWFLLQLDTSKKNLAVLISDEAALPLSMSKNLSYLHEQAGFYSITAGQAFGGQGEVVNVATGLQYFSSEYPEAAMLITLGPGVVGTGTHYGYSGLAQAEWANIVGALGGRPVWVPRLSEVDERKRHRGISHHTLTPLIELTFAKSILPLPTGRFSTKLLYEDEVNLHKYPHIEVQKIPEEKLWSKLDQVQKASPFPLTSMGRTIDKDPLFFLGIASAVQWYLDEEALHHSATV